MPGQKAQEWRAQLSDDDVKEINAWMRHLGPERVARIVIALAARGDHGRPVEADPALMCKMVELQRQDNTKSNGKIAREVAEEARQMSAKYRAPKVENLAKRLEDAFEKNELKWRMLAVWQTNLDQEPQKLPDNDPVITRIERRVLGRLADLLPEKLRSKRWP